MLQSTEMQSHKYSEIRKKKVVESLLQWIAVTNNAVGEVCSVNKHKRVGMTQNHCI